jgi:hypothetical protein
MPWTAKQLKLFRAAAHNPAIAKSSGIKQADAERMSKEGLKKAKGGAVPAMINRQDTRHGKMDMPYQKLNRFAGMKEGGVMKKRRFDEGGDVERLGEEGETQSFGDAFKEARGTGASTFTWRGKKYTTEMAKPAAKPVAKPAAKPAAKEESVAKEDAYSKAQKDSFLGSPGKYLSAPIKSLRERMSSGNQQAFKPRDRGFRKGGAIMRSKREIGKDQMGMAPYKKGGEMESKAMMKKEIGFMQKKGAPASMIKHEKAEMKGYKKGGSIKETMGPRNMSQDVEGGYKAKHLKHGEHSEQKRGHTKGTVVKMAAGGSVRAHGEHSIQKKGHTRGKMC